MNRGSVLLQLIEARRKILDKKNNVVKKDFKNINPEAYSDEQYFDEKSKGQGSEIVKLIRRKLY